jgi:hypothetical protein
MEGIRLSEEKERMSRVECCNVELWPKLARNKRELGKGGSAVCQGQVVCVLIRDMRVICALVI